MMSEIIRCDGKTKIKLADIDTGATGKMTKDKADARLEKIGAELQELQDLLYAAQETPFLIVLQGMDTAGKDGAIRSVIGFMNPQGCRVAAFKAPTPAELAHDFLWRVHSETPGKGTIAIFNRSHYEDVLVVRVHNLVGPEVWKKRYDDINNFERLLADNGAVILKFFLHISKDEQKERLLAREKDPVKAWKLSPDDWKERDYWDAYQTAYEDALNKCGTPAAPWFVVPADRKWHRNLVVAETIVEALRPLRDGWMSRLKAIGATELKALRAQRQTHS